MTDNLPVNEEELDREGKQNSGLRRANRLGCLAGISTTALAVFSSVFWFGIDKQYSESVKKAQTLADEVCSEKFLVGDITTIDKAIQKLDEATKLMQPSKIPFLGNEIPTSVAQTRQNELTKITNCRKDITFWFNANKEYSESVKKAKILVSEICSGKILASNSSMMDEASQKLSGATKLLQSSKILFLGQEVPASESETGQNELAKIMTCRKDIEKAKNERLAIEEKAKNERLVIENNSKRSERLKKAFLSFSNSLDIRNTYQSYSDQFSNLKSEFESVSGQILKNQENSTIKSLKKALESYEDALNVWTLCEEGKCPRTDLGKELFLPDSEPITTNLSDRYGIKIGLQPTLIPPQQGIKLKEALQTLWQRAKKDIDAAK
jgi:hypothetical protein